jgi:hypothetical protein
MKRLDGDSARRAQAELLHRRRAGEPFRVVVPEIAAKYGAAKSSVKKWWSKAQADILAAETELDRDNKRESRFQRMTLWDQRSRRFRQAADDRLDGPRKGQSLAATFERQALAYETLIAKSSGWFELPIETELDDPAILALVLNGLFARLHMCSRDQLIRGRDEFVRALAAHTGEIVDSDDEVF